MAELPVIDMVAVMELLGDDEEFLAELLTDFLEDEQGSIEKLRAAIAADNHKEFFDSAHLVKGAALNLALKALADVVTKTEMLGRALQRAKDQGLSEVEWDGAAHPVQELLDQRTAWVDKVAHEYTRVRQYHESKQG